MKSPQSNPTHQIKVIGGNPIFDDNDPKLHLKAFEKALETVARLREDTRNQVQICIMADHTGPDFSKKPFFQEGVSRTKRKKPSLSLIRDDIRAPYETVAQAYGIDLDEVKIIPEGICRAEALRKLIHIVEATKLKDRRSCDTESCNLEIKNMRNELLQEIHTRALMIEARDGLWPPRNTTTTRRDLLRRYLTASCKGVFAGLFGIASRNNKVPVDEIHAFFEPDINCDTFTIEEAIKIAIKSFRIRAKIVNTMINPDGREVSTTLQDKPISIEPEGSLIKRIWRIVLEELTQS